MTQARHHPSSIWHTLRTTWVFQRQELEQHLSIATLRSSMAWGMVLSSSMLLDQEEFMSQQQGFKGKPQSLANKIARKSRRNNSGRTHSPTAKTSRLLQVKAKFKVCPTLKLLMSKCNQVLVGFKTFGKKEKLDLKRLAVEFLRVSIPYRLEWGWVQREEVTWLIKLL